ncbi:MAG: hypothetical protein ACYC27_16185 [Armatimonadota bacterium]
MSLMDMLIEALQAESMAEESKIIDQIDSIEEPEHITPQTCEPSLYVATNLDSREIDIAIIDDEIIDGTCYRKLDAPYYAWLRSRMTGIKKAKKSGEFSDALYEQLRERFNVIHEWAIAHIGEDTLRGTIQSFDPAMYTPPTSPTSSMSSMLSTYPTGQSSVPMSPEAMKLGSLLSSQRYAVIKTNITDDPIIIAKDDNVPLPDQHKRKAVFTLAEVKHLVGISPEAIKQIIDIKQVIGGDVIGPSDGKPPDHDKPPDYKGCLSRTIPGKVFTVEPPPESFAKVDAIKDQALSLGWTESGLYRTNSTFPFPYGQDYGLVCHVGPDYTIGEVTDKAIELILTRTMYDGQITRSSTRHYNMDVDQPWIKKTESEKVIDTAN